MRKAYQEAAKFVRWVVAAVMAFIVALPVFTSIGAAS
ncbi:hypothetical protein GALL_73620 [mine drainage metagenome]|uniref:Uncharacterized protein n=1 Tax=mine drainage metagenome TaxID=410659 RepID=A0A1J5T4J8_9ZZZZ